MKKVKIILLTLLMVLSTVLGADSIQTRLQSIVIPKVNFDNTSPHEVFKYLSDQSKQLDKDGGGVDILWVPSEFKYPSPP